MLVGGGPGATGVPLPRASAWGVPACAEAGAAAVPPGPAPQDLPDPRSGWHSTGPRPPSARRPGPGELLGGGARPRCLIKDSLCLQATAWFFLPRVSLGQGWGRPQGEGRGGQGEGESRPAAGQCHPPPPGAALRGARRGSSVERCVPPLSRMRAGSRRAERGRSAPPR